MEGDDGYSLFIDAACVIFGVWTSRSIVAVCCVQGGIKVIVTRVCKRSKLGLVIEVVCNNDAAFELLGDH